jgi:lipopolysaccharide export system protein LptC
MILLRDRIYRLTSWLPLLFLAALAALTYWLDAQIEPPSSGRSTVQHQTPDLFIKNFHATQFDANGAPQQQLKAVLAEHFPHDGSINLEQPDIILLNPGQPRLTLTANHAQLSGDRKDLHLHGNVTAVREESPVNARQKDLPSEPMTLRTEYLHVRPDENVVQTHQKASLESPSGRIESIGMEVHRESSIIKLHSDIQGTFQPQPR